MSLTRREALRAAGVAAAALALRGIPALAQERRLNVLFIPVDDLSVRLSCYGHPTVKTPNLDKLAARGVLFERAYCQYPLCNPSRSSLLTGLRPETTRVLSNDTPLRDNLPDVVTLPQHFKQNGYETFSVGKVFHGKFPDPQSWTEDYSKDKKFFREMRRKFGPVPPPRSPRGPDAGPPTEEEKRRMKMGKRVLRNFKWGPSGLKDEQTADGIIAAKAIEILRRKHDKPFFLAAGFLKPHLPFIAPDKYFEMYPPEGISLPDVPKDDLADVPKAARYGTRDQKRLTEETWREAIAAYYACTTFVDAQIGKLLDALYDSPYADNTVVILWGDNGFHLGEHFLWRKGTLFEESCRVPMILAAPGIGKKGVKCPRLVEFVDIYPTLVELCGLPMPKGLEGTSMAPLLSDPNRAWKKGAFTTTRDGSAKSVRTERWRYNEWGSPEAAELYDHETDPHEYHNLAKDPAHADKVRELSDLLHAGWKAALPG